jgi:hypothetical protein
VGLYDADEIVHLQIEHFEQHLAIYGQGPWGGREILQVWSTRASNKGKPSESARFESPFVFQ